MGTEVLRPQDFFYDRFRLTPPAIPRRKNYKRPIPQKKKTQQLPHQQPPQLLPKRSSSSSSADELQRHEVVKVTILRRGQSLDTVLHAANKNFIQNDDVYAGSAFFVSPSPSSLPLPSFFHNSNNNTNNSHDSAATRDLRRLLRLE